MIYLHKTNGYWELDCQLPSSYKVGTTENDYNDGAYIALSDEQIAFHVEHPDASQIEVLRMVIEKESETLDYIKRKTIYNIQQYDSSCDVNTCMINDVATWIDLQQRTAWMCSLISAKNRGDEKITFTLMDQQFTLPIDTAFSLLDRLNGYADMASNVTNKHISNVKALETIEEVKAYNYKTGYPKIISLTINSEK